jgi:hypothetical protein
MAFGGHCLRQCLTRVEFIEQGLTLQIAALDKIAINDAEPSDSRPRKQARNCSANGAAAYQDGTRPEYPFLALLSNAREKNLAGVSFAIFGFHGLTG